MIIINTKLKTIPDRCTNCKYLRHLVMDSCSELHQCRVMNKEIKLKYIKEEGILTLLRPKWCPLEEVKDE